MSVEVQFIKGVQDFGSAADAAWLGAESGWYHGEVDEFGDFNDDTVGPFDTREEAIADLAAQASAEDRISGHIAKALIIAALAVAIGVPAIWKAPAAVYECRSIASAMPIGCKIIPIDASRNP